MLRNVFMGSPALAAIILERFCAEYGAPALVITQSAKAKGRGQKVLPTPVQLVAEAKGIPCHATENANDPAILEAMRAVAPDLILVAAFGQLLKNEILTLPRLYCLNVHGSLLPEYRGAAPIQQAIWDGKSVTGITIQRMVKKLDAGDILLERETKILPDETSGQLMDRLAGLGADCLIDAVKLVEAGNVAFTPQDPARVTFARKIEKEQARIDWTMTAAAIVNQVRALNPWPVAETTLGGERFRIHLAKVSEKAVSGPPGTVQTDGRTELLVAAGQGAVALTAVQAENRKRLEIREFLAAFRGNFPHRRLGEG